jgi:oligopeptide transport system substrate-binding protein
MVVGIAVGITGCSGDDATARTPGSYAVGVREPASLLPAEVRDLPGRMIAGALWTPLVTYDAQKQQVIPLAAASVTSSDRTVWTVRLRPGMRFHDGSPVTARSYVDTWQAGIAERWPGASVLTNVLRANDMRAVDETTIQLTLAKPFAQADLVLGSAALYPLPESVLANKNWSDFATNPVGNGPYRLAEPWRAGKGGRLVRFDGYQGAAPGKAREIELRVVTDPAAQYDQVRSGALDLATALPGAAHDAMRRDFPNRHLSWPLPELTYLSIPLSDNRFRDPTVRHAISLAVDRAAIEAGPLDRQVDQARALLPPYVALPQRSGPCRPCNHDPAAAKSLVEQAGTPTGPITLYYGQESWVPALAEQLDDALGVATTAKHRTEGQPLDGPTVVTRTLFSPSPREPMTELPGYTNSGFEDLLASADAAATPAESGQLYRLAENQILRDLPVVPLWSAHGHAVWNDRIRNVHSDPFRDLELAAIDVPS